jgi:hypothetical protein
LKRIFSALVLICADLALASIVLAAIDLWCGRPTCFGGGLGAGRRAPKIFAEPKFSPSSYLTTF